MDYARAFPKEFPTTTERALNGRRSDLEACNKGRGRLGRPVGQPPASASCPSPVWPPVAALAHLIAVTEVPSDQAHDDKSSYGTALASSGPPRGCSTEPVVGQHVVDTLDAMADAYSLRARHARTLQGRPPVITSPSALGRLASLMATAGPQTRPSGSESDRGAA